MLHHEFNGQIERLKTAFGEKALNPEKTALLWSKFKHDTIDNFASTVDHLILNNRSNPLVDDFYEARSATQRTFAKPQGDCTLCSNGWILPYHVYIAGDSRNIGVPTVRRCECKGGPDAVVQYLRDRGDNKTADAVLRDEADSEYVALFDPALIAKTKHEHGSDPKIVKPKVFDNQNSPS